MLSGQEFEHYERHLVLPEIGLEGQLRLRQARVAVVGAGGLGCPIVQYLVAAGVGYVRLIDDDRVCPSNLQRQILFTYDDVGHGKATAAARRMAHLNPWVKVDPVDARLSVANWNQLLADVDVVLDGTDNFKAKYLLSDACVLLKRPLVYGAVHKFWGQCALFSSDREDGLNYRDLFPAPPPAALAPNCAEAGVLGVLPGLIGVLQASLCLQRILGEDNADRLLGIDLQDLSFINLAIRRDIHNVARRGIYPALTDADPVALCGVNERDRHEVTAGDAFERIAMAPHCFLIDVRETSERIVLNAGGTHVPLASLKDKLTSFGSDPELYFYCASGKRSTEAATLARRMGFSRAWSIQGGAMAILKQSASRETGKAVTGSSEVDA
jgi:sulfur-carrier protein adenylyltransferase/sulfurtransferase